MLRTDEAAQRRCEDGSEFAQVLAEWREAERQAGRRPPSNANASNIMHALSQQRKLKVKKAGDGVVVVVFCGSVVPPPVAPIDRRGDGARQHEPRCV